MPKYKATAYIRLSYTDDRSSESDSVANQRKLIENFVERNPDIEVISEKIDDGYSGIIFDRPAFKEMMLHVPWLYHYAGRPDLSVRRVRECMRRYFAPGPDGLADNEDMGCQSAFYMCAAMGAYPMMGQDLYLLGAPVFESVEVALGRSGKTLRIEAPAHDDGAFVDEIYLDGAPLGRAWIRHAQIKDGAVLRFSFSDVDTGFGRNIPPPGAMD